MKTLIKQKPVTAIIIFTQYERQIIDFTGQSKKFIAKNYRALQEHYKKINRTVILQLVTAVSIQTIKDFGQIHTVARIKVKGV